MAFFGAARGRRAKIGESRNSACKSRSGGQHNRCLGKPKSRKKRWAYTEYRKYDDDKGPPVLLSRSVGSTNAGKHLCGYSYLRNNRHCCVWHDTARFRRSDLCSHFFSFYHISISASTSATWYGEKSAGPLYITEYLVTCVHTQTQTHDRKPAHFNTFTCCHMYNAGFCRPARLSFGGLCRGEENT